jgi:hypothetical protein
MTPKPEYFDMARFAWDAPDSPDGGQYFRRLAVLLWVSAHLDGSVDTQDLQGLPSRSFDALPASLQGRLALFTRQATRYVMAGIAASRSDLCASLSP